MTRFAIFLITLAPLIASAQIKVAVLHPLLEDLVVQVGGENVEVRNLMGPNGDPHHFQPTPAQLEGSADLTVVFACGLGLEGDLSTLRSVLPEKTQLVEIGKQLPTIEGGCDDPDHDHAAHDGDHGTDPHWWHSVDATRRAVTVIEAQLSRSDSDHADAYRRRAMVYRNELDDLDRWVRREIARIPQGKRVLATTHAAFGYFCRDHRFESVAVQGLTREQMPDAASLAGTFADLRDKHVRIIFPEKGGSPGVLKALVSDGGFRLGPPLDADGTHSPTYVEMMKSNVSAIRSSLMGGS